MILNSLAASVTNGSYVLKEFPYDYLMPMVVITVDNFIPEAIFVPFANYLQPQAGVLFNPTFQKNFF